MAEARAPNDPIPIGEAVAPAFVRLPDPQNLFLDRAERFRTLAVAHDLAPYLRFLGELCAIQARIQPDLPDPSWPSQEEKERAQEFGMPPLDRNRFAPDAAADTTLARLIASLRQGAMPEASVAALARVAAAGVGARHDMFRNLLADAIPVEALAEHALIAAALQVHFARLATSLDPKRMNPAGDGACPACGGPPVASLIVGWQGAHGTRYCACALCGTLWNYVRIKCTLCGSTKGIAYHGVEGDAGTVKAETCESCRGYVKIMYQHKEPALDPVADDVATLGLDLLVQEAGFRRGAFNPFLLGY